MQTARRPSPALVSLCACRPCDGAFGDDSARLRRTGWRACRSYPRTVRLRKVAPRIRTHRSCPHRVVAVRKARCRRPGFSRSRRRPIAGASGESACRTDRGARRRTIAATSRTDRGGGPGGRSGRARRSAPARGAPAQGGNFRCCTAAACRRIGRCGLAWRAGRYQFSPRLSGSIASASHPPPASVFHCPRGFLEIGNHNAYRLRGNSACRFWDPATGPNSAFELALPQCNSPRIPSKKALALGLRMVKMNTLSCGALGRCPRGVP